MSERKFRKGDRLRTTGDSANPVESTFIYEVLSDEGDSGKVRIKLIEQSDPKHVYSTSPFRISVSSIRRAHWELISEGPAKRPNTRRTRIKASEIRLLETIQYEGDTFVVTDLRGKAGVWTVTGEDKIDRVIEGTDDMTVIGARGRQRPKTVHFNQFVDEGVVSIRRNWRPGFGSFGCGIVSLQYAMASSVDLVTCEQKCKEEALENHWRRVAKRAKESK